MPASIDINSILKHDACILAPSLEEAISFSPSKRTSITN